MTTTRDDPNMSKARPGCLGYIKATDGRPQLQLIPHRLQSTRAVLAWCDRYLLAIYTDRLRVVTKNVERLQHDVAVASADALQRSKQAVVGP